MNYFIDLNKLKEWVENVDLDKCKNYILLNSSLLRANEFSEINPNIISERLLIGIKLYLLDEFDNVFSFYSHYEIISYSENCKSKSSTEFLWNLKIIKYVIDKAALPIFMKIKNQPFEKVKDLVYGIDLDECEEHSIKHSKNVFKNYLLRSEKKEEKVNENYFLEDGVFDYLMVKFYKKIRKIHKQNLPFITELEDENIIKEELFDIFDEASETITKALNTSFNPDNF